MLERARDGDALALPDGEAAAPLADHGVVALGEPRDEVVGVGGLRGGLHRSVAELRDIHGAAHRDADLVVVGSYVPEGVR